MVLPVDPLPRDDNFFPRSHESRLLQPGVDPGGRTWGNMFSSVCQSMPYFWQAARFDNSPVRTWRRTSVHISMSANTPRDSLLVGGNRGFATILLINADVHLCAAFSNRPGYPQRAALFDRRSQFRLRCEPVTMGTSGKWARIWDFRSRPMGSGWSRSGGLLAVRARLASCPWTKPSMAFVHLADRWKRRGFPPVGSPRFLLGQTFSTVC
jgi:hypothetical protein